MTNIEWIKSLDVKALAGFIEKLVTRDIKEGINEKLVEYLESEKEVTHEKT